MTTGASQDDSAVRGFAFAFGAYGLWGLMPIWVKAIEQVPAVDIVAYRVLFSVPVAGVILLALGRTTDLKAAFRHPRTLLMAGVTGTLIALNWGIYT